MKYKVHTIVKKRRRVRLIKTIIALVSILIIATSFILVMRSQVFKIKNVEISGAVVLDSDSIRSQVAQILSGNYLFVFPKDNIFLLPKKEIINNLQKNNPRIGEMSVSLKSDNLSIEITERKPDSLWCGASFSEIIDSCLFVDSTGFVFSEAPQFDGSSFIKFYGKGLDATASASLAIVATSTETAEATTTPQSWKFLDKHEYSDILHFISDVKGLGIEINAVEVADGQYNFQIKNNGLLMVNRNVYSVESAGDTSTVGAGSATDPSGIAKDNLQDAVDNLRAAISSKALFATSTSKSTVQPQLAQFEYIDLRFGNKIFYKRR
jgi:hypothetical protein